MVVQNYPYWPRILRQTWRGLLIAHSRLVPAIEADLRAAGQVPLVPLDVSSEAVDG